MKRISALMVIPAVALALTSCGGDGHVPQGHAGSSSASTTASFTSPGTESAVPSTGSATPGPSTSDSATPNPEASVIGQWGGDTEGAPVLWFAETGRYNGNDGCNTLNGSWVADGGRVALKDMTMTAMACPGMDTWLSLAAAVQVVQVKGQMLHVDNADGQKIGTLPRSNVAD
ncbi:META domain-containing protein [Paeniglutamicibacter gangotriensis]|uniref:META domain-containing protein n=1 Tax=Paeniglutamicibacter gangotriensis TaxID=254787 RepID=UPI00165FA839|nr:META domain-containing protein [Paeniglutamicibacter gangotriensis]